MTTVPNATSDDKQDFLWKARCGMLFKAWVQVRYHRRRQRFFDLTDKCTKAITLILGASLFGAYVQPYAPWVGTAISALGLLALVFGYSDRKQLHKELAEKSAGLVKSIESVPADLINDIVSAAWASEYAELASKAPPQLKSLTVMCEDEQSCADGHPGLIRRPGIFRRFFAQLV